MAMQHIRLDYDVQNNKGIWLRSYSTNCVQYHTKAGLVYDGLMARCRVGGNYQERFSTYINCKSDFSSFHEFAEWCQTQYNFGYKFSGKGGWHLDKDILSGGSGIYSPATCCFVPNFVNLAVVIRYKDTSEVTGLPLGVTMHHDRFRARCSTLSGREHLGVFTTPQEAHIAWQMAKSSHIRAVANSYILMEGASHSVYDSLLEKADNLLTSANNQEETFTI